MTDNNQDKIIDLYQQIIESGRNIARDPKDGKLKVFPVFGSVQVALSDELSSAIRANWQELKALTEKSTLMPVKSGPKPVITQKAALPPPLPKGQQQLFFGESSPTHETDSVEKKRSTPKKKTSAEVVAEEVTDWRISPDELKLLKRLRDSHRVPFYTHWMVCQAAKYIEDNPNVQYKKRFEMDLKMILANWGNCPYLNTIDEMNKNCPINTHFTVFCKEDAFKYLKDRHTDLQMYCGYAIFLPQMIEGEVTEKKIRMADESFNRQHCWMVAPDGGIVDPLYLVYPHRIFSYKGNRCHD